MKYIFDNGTDLCFAIFYYVNCVIYFSYKLEFSMLLTIVLLITLDNNRMLII